MSDREPPPEYSVHSESTSDDGAPADEYVTPRRLPIQHAEQWQRPASDSSTQPHISLSGHSIHNEPRYEQWQKPASDSSVQPHISLSGYPIDNKPRYEQPPAPSSTSALDHPKPIDLDEADIEVQGETEFTRAMRVYGNPLAVDKEWSVQPGDEHMAKLPQIAWTHRLKQGFKKSRFSSPSSQMVPSFRRDPRLNPKFHPEQYFETIYVNSASRGSEYLCDGFKRYYSGHVMPFHDVSPADLYQFLEDIVTSTRLPNIPTGNHIPVYRIFSRLSERILKGGENDRVYEIIKLWQRQFFQQRGIAVSIRDLGENRHDEKRSESAGRFQLVISSRLSPKHSY